MPIDETTRLKRTSRLLETDVHGEVVALDVEKGQCYGLDAIGSEIWRHLESPTSVEEICSDLVSKYEVDPTTCKSDVMRLVSDLHDEGLVTVQG
jgi:hypothetical protein